MVTRVMVVLFTMSALYAFLLEQIRTQYEPKYVWLVVIGGTILSLLAPWYIRWRSRMLGIRITAEVYEQLVLLSFAVSGAPILFWQIVLLGRI